MKRISLIMWHIVGRRQYNKIENIHKVDYGGIPAKCGPMLNVKISEFLHLKLIIELFIFSSYLSTPYTTDYFEVS